MTKIKTDRIELICRLLNEGKSRKYIQSATGLSESAVRWYIHNYLKKTVTYAIIKPLPREC